MDTTTRPTARDLRNAHIAARKEHSERAALEGWKLTAEPGDRPGMRHSYDLYPEQPVLIHGHVLAWSTGVEVGNFYELRLGTIHGPIVHSYTVVPCTEENLELRRAQALAAALHHSLGTIKAHSQNLEDHGTLNMLRDKTGRVMSRLDRF